MVPPPKPPYPFRERRQSSLYVALPSPWPHFPAPSAASIRRYSNSGRTLQRSASDSVPGASPVLRFRPPQADKQAAERTAPPPARHFRISPAYRYIYPHREAPWGTHRTKPAQGRATFTLIVLRWRHGGGLYCPSPSPPGFPLSKGKKEGFALSASLRYAPVANPSFHGSKGEG
jgi:hypothetical protein